jgi:Phosphopantetheine attachment site
VLACWRSVLGNDRLSFNDNVFEHGAHSVLAVQVRGMLQSRLKRDISVVLLFQHPTSAALAAALQQPSPEDLGRSEKAATQRAQQRRAAAKRPRSTVDDVSSP